MSKGFLERLVDIGVAGTALASSSTQTSLMVGNTGEMGTLPAKYFERIGKAIKVRATGRVTTADTSPGTLNLYVRFGSIDVWDSGAMTLNATAAKTNVPWVLELELVCRSIGSGTSATLIGAGLFTSEVIIASAAPTAGGAPSHVLPYNTAPAVGSGFDSSASQLIDFQAKWSLTEANSIRLETFAVDIWS